MIMGKIISRTTYEYYEYVTAILISIGMTLFMLDSSDYKNGNVTILFRFLHTDICKRYYNGLINAFRRGYDAYWCRFIGRLFSVR